MAPIEACEIGPRREERRCQPGCSLTDLASQPRIRQDYLQALEAGEFERLPGEAYRYGFLPIYGDALDLSAGGALERYRRSRTVFDRQGLALQPTGGKN